MTALQYVINEASQAGRPVAVNISYGHNYGDHRGNSLLERFISQIAQQWKCTICIGTGNEGNSGKHKQGKLIKEEQKILLDIAPFEQNLNLQIWKDFVDELRISWYLHREYLMRSQINRESHNIHMEIRSSLYTMVTQHRTM